MARRDVSIRWSLLRNLLLLIAFLSGSILAVTFVGARRAVRRLSGDIVLRTTERVDAELERFFEPVTRALLVARDWGASRRLSCTDRECLNALFHPVMARTHQVSSFNTGDAEGRGVMLLRDPDGWRNREVRRDEWGPVAEWTRWSPRMEPLRTWREELDYDPRERPWYVIVQDLEADAEDPMEVIRWSQPYTFFTTKEPGITASIPVTGPDGEPWVVAFDVLLGDITAFTMTLDVSEHGVAFVAAEDGRLVGLPGDRRFADADARREAILEQPGALGLATVASTLAAGRDSWSDDGARRPTAFSFEEDGERWWGGVQPLRLPGGPRFWMGVAVPESDLLGDLAQQRTLIMILTALALAAATVLALVLARRYSRPLEALTDQSERIRNLEMGAEAIAPSHLREVNRLRDAQESMRSALDSFSRYVPTEVVRDLLKRGEAARIGGRSETLTVLFTDIEDFTTISEGMAPAGVTAHMAEYFGALLPIVRDSGGTIDKLVGDAIIAFWGAPTPLEDHAARAVSAVQRCRDRLEILNAAWPRQGKPALRTRFGLATGSVVVGNVGTRARLHYTALGDTMNLGARLEGANKVYGTEILAAEATVTAAGPAWIWRLVDRVAVKGRKAAVNVYELLGRRGEVPLPREARARRYEVALRHFQARRFAEALEILAVLAGEDGADAGIQRLAGLCRSLQASPPPDDWDGVAYLTQK